MTGFLLVGRGYTTQPQRGEPPPTASSDSLVGLEQTKGDIMVTWEDRFLRVAGVLAIVLIISCSPDAGDSESILVSSSALTAQDRLSACAQDPRVITGLVSQDICAGADVFFRETFNGNGRTCATCHPANNNFTLDPASVAARRASNPADPLFVSEQNPQLAELDNTDALNRGGIRENVDGFEDPVHKFVSRGVPHLLSMKTSIAADTGDGTANPPVERTGWGGDGAPGDGSLRSFLTGAVTQHYTKTLKRRPGIDFRLPTSQELDLVLAFQLALGRLNELDLTQVRIFDANGEQGRQAFIVPARGGCNVCHFNAGANFQDTGKNRNFDTGTRQLGFLEASTFKGAQLFDAGFGGQGLANPNVSVDPFFDGSDEGINDGFGNNTFNTPPLIEAADTSPFFHNNQEGGTFLPGASPVTGLEDAINFYACVPFGASPAFLQLQARFGGNFINLSDLDIMNIGRFLRALNVALNLDMAKQRLQAALMLANQFPNTRVDIQLGLLNLGAAELDDAQGVLTALPTETAMGDPLPSIPFYPVAVNRIGLAKGEIAAALKAPASSRAGHISNAVSRVENARDQIGVNITFQLGQGNLMF